jgi:septal ring factor EnvC (AmiA/AmiB activator)
MTDEELNDRLQKIENRISSIEQSIGRMEQERAYARKEKHATKRQSKGRRKSYGHSGQNKAPKGPKFKSGRPYPKP